MDKLLLVDIAKNIVNYRTENGAFTSREQLLNVPKLGAKAYEQCAGFLRIVDGKNIVPAGTALNINLMDLQVRAKAPTTGSPMNAVLLHDVDMTNVAEGGAMNGTALIWGFVNVNRLRAAEQSSIVTAAAIDGGTDKITLLKA